MIDIKTGNVVDMLASRDYKDVQEWLESFPCIQIFSRDGSVTYSKAMHSVDYFWLSRMWADRGKRMHEADIVVSPKDAKETLKILQIANYYKLPVTTWGGGEGTQGGTLPVCGGTLLDTKRMNKIYDINTEPMYMGYGNSTGTWNSITEIELYQ